MLKGIYDTASGMLPHLVRQDLTANNLANANTTGFKRQLVFSQEFSEAQRKLLPTGADWEKARIIGIKIDFSPGPMERTEDPLHLAIDGDAFFVIDTPNGEMYTRGGNFTASPEGRLVTLDGYPVMSTTGEIIIEGGEFIVDSRGQMIVDDQSIGQLQLVTFPQPYPLQPAAPGLFAVVPGGPGPSTAEEFSLRQGMLEGANVNLISEMVNMIESYREFETGQRLLQIQDETLGKAVNQLGARR